ncbi:hypothetical protein N836_01255 [Leptolyngbya sp. Heron Island J]|uniref:hypothetical protein n=1 Tax=Leptolyngbya sp. Heron Island J TaxID=1385935 RepID=UPI0003B9BCE2|nr:hypothetical protein [Leptolyngbya sp. Heron Island J]ESA34462.1 hypothetical protein N836_01255 [Leptolyngbya sp. Heron Island J]
MHQTNKTQALDGQLAAASPAQLAQLWAKRYVISVEEYNEQGSDASLESRPAIVEHLTSELRSASAKAWNLTESLLAQEVKRHRINSTLIDPWSVAGDVRRVYVKALMAYANYISPRQLSVKIASSLGAIRKRYTAGDPRLIGFVSMQFHHCGQMLVEAAPQEERDLLFSYFKVIDDHLYMPLQRAYEAAARYAYDDERLKVIQALLPYSTEIANTVVNRVNQLYPNYQCYTDLLNSEVVRMSSVRDTEMFQIYLWTCVLEQSLAPIQQELFPLCVMLYPTLKVNWELVRQMLHLLGREFNRYVEQEQVQHYAPYHQALWEMFSPSVFPDVI